MPRPYDNDDGARAGSSATPSPGPSDLLAVAPDPRACLSPLAWARPRDLSFPDMHTSTFDVVFPFTVLVFLGVAAPLFMVGANWFLNRQRRSFQAKEEAYECGLSSTVGGADERFSIRFYLIAMIFLAFDIEVAFLYPWAIRFLKGGWDMLWILLAFLVVLESVYMYLWRKGALDWD